jgi:Mg2+ and Co2+ transporter CorA
VGDYVTTFLQARKQRQLIIEKLKGSSVRVQLTPMFLFLLRGGDCVISIHPLPDLQLTQPIMNRLKNPASGLRTSTDASLLVQSLLDLTVDLVLEIVEEYEDTISELEQDVLFKPSMATTRRLHILSGDIHHLKRTLEPLQTMIGGLRKYDTERTIAASLGYDMAKGRPRDDTSSPPHERSQGYMSYRATIYLSDVYDHINFAIQSLETFAGAADHLIDFAFNMASYEMNTTMKQLTLASIIFLPLTLLTGYFGMNFDKMTSVQDHSESLFWIIALPVMGVLIPTFVHAEIIRAVRAVYKRFTLRQMAAQAQPKGLDSPANSHIT